VDAKIIGVQLELVAGPDAAVLLRVHKEGGNGTVQLELPMLIPRRVGLKIDELLLCINCECTVHSETPSNTIRCKITPVNFGPPAVHRGAFVEPTRLQAILTL